MSEDGATQNLDAFEREYRRLRVFLGDTGAFSLALATYGNPADRDRLIARLRDDLTADGIQTLTLNIAATSDETSLLSAATETAETNGVAPQNAVLMVVNAEHRMDFQSGGTRTHSIPLFETANIHRELFATSVPIPVVLWLSPMAHRIFAREAPDLWHWRTGSFDFLRGPSARIAWLQDQRPSDPFLLQESDREELQRRLANLTELWEWLDESSSKDDREATREEKLDVLTQVAITREQLRDYHGALANFEAAEELLGSSAELSEASANWISQWAVIVEGKATALQLIGHTSEAINDILEKIPVLKSCAQKHPKDAGLQALLGTFFASAGNWLSDGQDDAVSLAYYDRALDHLRQAGHLAPGKEIYRRMLAEFLQYRAQVTKRQGENEDAVSFLREAIDLRRTLAANNDATTDDQSALQGAIIALARVECDIGRLDDAETLTAEAIAIARDIIGKSPERLEPTLALVRALVASGDVKMRRGDFAAAESAGLEGIEHLQQKLETGGQRLPLLGYMANLQIMLSLIFFEQNEPDRAASALEDAKHYANESALLAPEDKRVQKDIANIAQLEAKLQESEQNVST